MNSKYSTLSTVMLAVSLLAMATVWGGHSQKAGSTSSALNSEAPPGVRFVSVALGGFRGLLADILWVRAAGLQEDGKFFEVAQLADWITRLEPRYPEVWAYHAWNMAYNITAVVSDPVDRWHWVKNSIRLLRDEGIPSNPTNPKLYWELGWLFYDKVGGRWDEATPYYRIVWAGEISQLLGGGGVDYSLIEKQGKAASLLAAEGLDLKEMKALDVAYGPLDWRLPESHAMYWGHRGRTLASLDAVWCERLVWMALTETLKGGALAYAPDQHLYQRGPRLDVARKALRQCVAVKPEEDPLVTMARLVFLREAALYFYAFDCPVEAKEAFQQLKKGNAPDVNRDTTLDAFIQKEITDRMKGLDKTFKEKMVMDQLVKSDIWRRLNVMSFSDGYARLARLYWENAFGAEGTENAFQALQKSAQEHALLQMSAGKS